MFSPGVERWPHPGDPGRRRWGGRSFVRTPEAVLLEEAPAPPRADPAAVPEAKRRGAGPRWPRRGPRAAYPADERLGPGGSPAQRRPPGPPGGGEPVVRRRPQRPGEMAGCGPATRRSAATRRAAGSARRPARGAPAGAGRGRGGRLRRRARCSPTSPVPRAAGVLRAARLRAARSAAGRRGPARWMGRRPGGAGGPVRCGPGGMAAGRDRSPSHSGVPTVTGAGTSRHPARVRGRTRPPLAPSGRRPIHRARPPPPRRRSGRLGGAAREVPRPLGWTGEVLGEHRGPAAAPAGRPLGPRPAPAGATPRGRAGPTRRGPARTWRRDVSSPGRTPAISPSRWGATSDDRLAAAGRARRSAPGAEGAARAEPLVGRVGGPGPPSSATSARARGAASGRGPGQPALGAGASSRRTASGSVRAVNVRPIAASRGPRDEAVLPTPGENIQDRATPGDGRVRSAKSRAGKREANGRAGRSAYDRFPHLAFCTPHSEFAVPRRRRGNSAVDFANHPTQTPVRPLVQGPDVGPTTGMATLVRSGRRRARRGFSGGSGFMLLGGTAEGRDRGEATRVWARRLQ